MNRVATKSLEDPDAPVEQFYALKWSAIWNHLKREHASFWMICCYLVFEYVRPQSIFPALDFLPWAQLFLALSLLFHAFQRQPKWTWDVTNFWMIAFLVVVILASATATYPAISWSHFNDFFSWFVIYFLITNIVTTEKRFLIFLGIFLLASAKLSISCTRIWAMRGFSFTSWGLMGPPGFFQNSGELAIQMLMFAPVSYETLVFLKPHITKGKYAFIALFPITAAMTIIGASSRGGQIGLAVEAYFALLKGKFSLRKILIIGAVAYAGFLLLPQEQIDRFRSAGDDETSQQRLLYWQRGVEMIKEHPLLGVGYFNFPDYFKAHYPQDLHFRHAELPHNIFIQVGTDAGWLGLLVFLILMWRTIQISREIKKLSSSDPAKPFARISAGLATALWGFVIAGQFVTVTYYPFFWINLALMVALKHTVRAHYENQPANPSTGQRSTHPGRELPIQGSKDRK